MRPLPPPLPLLPILPIHPRPRARARACSPTSIQDTAPTDPSLSFLHAIGLIWLEELVCDAEGCGHHFYEEEVEAGGVEEGGVGVVGVVGGEGGVEGHRFLS